MFEIKNNIPVPSGISTGRPTIEFPFAELQPKQAFFVPLGDEGKKQVLARVRAKCQRWKKTTGLTALKFRISPFAHPDTAEPSVGVWRIS